MKPQRHIVNKDKWPGGISDGLTLRCSYCQVVPSFDYTVTDEAWRTVVPKKYRPGVLCLPCFEDLATLLHVDLSKALLRVQFVGQGKTIVLKPTDVYLWNGRKGKRNGR